MKIEFLGGARTVTGSSFLVRGDDFNVMVDCGLFQGTNEIRDRNYSTHNAVPQPLTALLCTHAHIDHTGLIPKLVINGYDGPIYATKATVDLCSIMLPDSGHIQEMDADFVNTRNHKLGRPPVKPLYTAEEAMQSLKNFVPLSYDETVTIHPRVKARFRNAGHILGSSFIEMWVEERGRTTKIVFSGDIGPKGQAIIQDPDTVEEADILLIESTYGDRLHKSKEETYREFKEIILEAYNHKGNIIIPAFAVERTQEIIYTLAKLIREGEIPPIPVIIDSPLAISATEIFKKNSDLFDDDMRSVILSGKSPLDFPSLSFSRTTEESKRLNTEAKGTIIISANGMCTAGRIKHHLKYNLYRPESSIVFVGYQAEGTLGRRLIDGATQVRVYGTDVAVKAKIYTIGGFSAHADRQGLLDWMRHLRNPDLRVFVIHGEEKSSRSFAEAIRNEFGLDVLIPEWKEIVDCSTMSREHPSLPAAPASDELDEELNLLFQTVQALMNKYRTSRLKNGITKIDKIRDDVHDVRELIKMIHEEL